MFLRRYTRTKDGKTHTYYALVESVRTDAGPRQHVVAYLGDQSPALGAAMNSDELADFVPVPDVRFGWLPLVFQILRGDADGGVRIENIVVADFGYAFEVDVGHEPCACSDINAGSNDAVRPDFRAVCDAGLGVDDRGRMNRHVRP